MANDEPVTAPDQHRPTIGKRAARVGAVFTILALVAMTIGDNAVGGVEKIFLYGTAALILAFLVGDWLLRKNGLR